MSDPEPFAPRQFNPNEVFVPPAARESFANLRHLGGAVLWLCALATFTQTLVTWQTANPNTWLLATREITSSVWMPILGSVLLLQDLPESITRRHRSWLSLMVWSLFAWGLLLASLVAASGLATSRLYQKQTEGHSAEEVVRSERFQHLRIALKDTSEAAEMKRIILAGEIPIPPSEALPEAPRVLREHLVNLIGLHEDKLDRSALEQLRTDHADTLFRGLAHLFAAIVAASVCLLAWARSGWIRMLRE